MLREEAVAAEVRERARQSLENLRRLREVWDESKHPRLGGPPNAGWFASTGGSGSTAQLKTITPKPDSLAHPRRDQDALAQAPQPGPGGPPLPRRGKDRYPNKFGTWPRRPPNYVAQRPRENGMFWHKLQMKRAYNKLPKPIKDLFDEHQVEVSLDKDDSTLREKHPAMEKNIGGAYESSTGTIHMLDTTPGAGGIRPPTNDLTHTLHHEVGHAVDHYLNDLSQSPEFIQAYLTDLNAAARRRGLSRAQAHSLSNSKEAFAEAFARVLNGRAADVLPNTVRFLQNHLAIRQLLGLQP